MRRPGIAAYCAVGEDSTFLRQRFRNGILHHGSPNKRNFAGAKTFSRPKKTGPVAGMASFSSAKCDRALSS
jgi:hypothetical protein